MDLKEDFKRDWRKQFVSATLPDLRCFASVKGVRQELLNDLDLDEKELKERLEQVKFTHEWIVKKRGELEKSNEDRDREYINLAPTRSTRNKPPTIASIRQTSTEFTSKTKDNVKESNSANRTKSQAGSRYDNEKREQLFQNMKIDLAKKLSLDDCHRLSYYFSGLTREDKMRISSTSSFIDLLEKVAAISELSVDDLMGALKVEQLQDALIIVKEYRDYIRATTEDSFEGSEERYLEMLPVKVDTVDSIVSDYDLMILSRKIDTSFKTFGRDVLKFTAKEIKKWQLGSDEEHQQALRMLSKWKQRLGHLATTAQLLALLKEFKYGQDVWGFLEGIDTPEGEHNDEPGTTDAEWCQSVVIKGYIKVLEDELSVKKGDKIMIQDRGRPGWYFGEVLNQRGWVPNYCVREEDEIETQLRFLFVVKANVDSGQWEEGFLTYRLGEHLDVIEETFIKSNKIYRARNKHGFMGFIQPGNFFRLFRKETILCDREWFHPKVMRHHAEMLLRPCMKGDYLIREASKPPDFVLNVKTAEDITNFLIKTTNVGYKILDKKFNSIHEIIEYYKRHPTKGNLYLRAPVSKQ